MKKRMLQLMAITALVMGALLAVPVPALAEAGAEMYRLYNPNSGEHFYTGSAGAMKASPGTPTTTRHTRCTASTTQMRSLRSQLHHLKG